MTSAEQVAAQFKTVSCPSNRVHRLLVSHEEILNSTADKQHQILLFGTKPVLLILPQHRKPAVVFTHASTPDTNPKKRQ